MMGKDLTTLYGREFIFLTDDSKFTVSINSGVKQISANPTFTSSYIFSQVDWENVSTYIRLSFL